MPLCSQTTSHEVVLFACARPGRKQHPSRHPKCCHLGTRTDELQMPATRAFSLRGSMTVAVLSPCSCSAPGPSLQKCPGSTEDHNRKQLLFVDLANCPGGTGSRIPCELRSGLGFGRGSFKGLSQPLFWQNLYFSPGIQQPKEPPSHSQKPQSSWFQGNCSTCSGKHHSPHAGVVET